MAHDDDAFDPHRRVFLQRLSFFGGGVVLLGACDEKKPAAPPTAKPVAQPVQTSKHLTFTNEEFLTLSAACERILPKDEDVGAIEAGVPEYIDRVLQSPEIARMRDDFVPGVAALDRRARRNFQKAFAECTAEQQDQALTEFKNSEPKSGEARWYELLVVFSLEGYLGDPSYGGNKNGAGWKTMGFELVGREAAEPPPEYDGVKHLHALHCGGGKGC